MYALSGQAVQPVDHDLGQMREELQEHDPGIARRKVGPLRTRALDLQPTLLKQLAEVSIVEIGRRQRHRLHPSEVE